jgi:hypothetical protein
LRCQRSPCSCSGYCRDFAPPKASMRELTPMRPPVVKSNSVAPRPSSDVPESRIEDDVPTSVSHGCRADAGSAPNTYGGSRPGMTRSRARSCARHRAAEDPAALETVACPHSGSFKANGLSAEASSSYCRARRGAGHVSIRSLEERDGRPFKRNGIPRFRPCNPSGSQPHANGTRCSCGLLRHQVPVRRRPRP